MLNKPLIIRRPYFWGSYVMGGGGSLTSHESNVGPGVFSDWDPFEAT